jgi:STE24 endopeptidase
MVNKQKQTAETVVYNKIKKRISIAEIVVTIIILLFFSFSRFTVNLSEYTEFHFDNVFLRFFIFTGVLSAIMFLVNFGFTYYSGYVIEKDFKLSNQTLLQWFQEQLKGFALTLVIAIPVAAAFYTTLLYGKSLWWFYFATTVVFLSVILARIAPVLLYPIFYKFTAVVDEKLIDKIEHHLKPLKISLNNVYSFDLSKNTKKANAAFAGIGKSKRVLLSDTLLENFTIDEIGAVFAHEAGHYCHKHIVKLMMLSTGIQYLTYYLCSLAYGWYLKTTGFIHTYKLEALPFLILLLTLFSLLSMPFVNYVSRKFEWEADTYALTHDSPINMKSALEKLSELNYADKQAHPVYEFIFYSHPRIDKRIKYAQNFSGKNNYE